ncbi:Tuberous sclerosis 2 protein-like protein [Exophiala dermatitidis]
MIWAEARPGRMSTGNDPSQQRPSNIHPDREARRLSLWHIPVLAQNSRNIDNASQFDRNPEKLPQDESPVDLSSVLYEGRLLGDSPEEARSWLLSFGNFKSGTDVSLRLLDIHKDDQGRPLPESLLSLLIQWVPLWSKRADKARKETKNSRSGVAVKEQKHLHWLLEYVSDYLESSNVGFDPLELSRTVACVTTLCLNASREEDIDAGVNVLYTILTHFDYPREGLDETLVVLCASAANLSKLPKHLFDCSRILASGYLHKEVMEALYSFLQTPTHENGSKNLSHARGATHHLRALVDERRHDGEFILDLTEFLTQLHSAAGHGVFRLCYDILSLLHAAISSEQRRPEVSALDFSIIINIIRLCLEMTPSGYPAANTAKTSLSPTPSPEEELQRHYEKRLRDRETMVRKLGEDIWQVWDELPAGSRDSVHEFFLDFPQYADSDLLSLTLDYAKHKYLNPQDSSVADCHAAEIFVRILQDESLSAGSRSKAIEMLVQLKDQPFAPASTTGPQINGSYVWIFGKLLDQIEIERNPKVLNALLNFIQSLLSDYCEAAKHEELVIRTIEETRRLILAGHGASPCNEDVAVTGTKVLAYLFSYSIHTSTKPAIRAFEVLLEIASSQCRFRPARLVAKRLLFRIRADDGGFIYIVQTSESQQIASALLRTRESVEIFNTDIPSMQRHSASSTSLSTKSDIADPLWMYPDTEDAVFPLAGQPSTILNVDESSAPQAVAELDMDTWLMSIIRCLQADTDWETYSYTVVHAAAQINNISLFLNSMEAVVKLRQILCDQIVNNSFREAPAHTGLKRSDVAICMFNFLIGFIPYATIKTEAVQKGFGDDLVRALLVGIGGLWEGTSRPCIHALSVCSLEIPASVATLYPTIIDKMSKNMTQTHLTAHILEFLIQVSLLPEMHSNLNPDEIQMIFGMCIQFLEKTREQQHASLSSPPGRIHPVSRHSGLNFRRPPYRASMLTDIGLPQYSACQAYHNMIFWFLSLRLEIRAKYVPWIVPRLVWKNVRGEETIDEQSEVLIDMMQRSAFSDLGETSPDPNFAGPEDGPVNSASWIVGLSVITAETAGHSGKTQIIKRQASGTTYARYQQMTAPLPSHHAPSHTEIRHEETTTIEVLPPHILLQMVASAAPTGVAEQPLLLPKEDYVTRALESIDRIPTVSSHKIGVLYIGEGQSDESDYLANTEGSRDFERLLDGLGYAVSLKPPIQFNPQGLEYPRDGEKTIAWRDRVSEIVYLVPTMMPTDQEDDPQCIMKKAHVGNCHVNIIFNRSGKVWTMDNFKSQLNYVNIVITPAGQKRTTPDPDYMPGFYTVQVVTRDDLPNISPAADPKTISAAQLAAFVRVLALNTDMFCQTWNTKDNDTEFPSTWRARLQQIKRLKERVATRSMDRRPSSLPFLSGTSSAPGAGGGRRTPASREEEVGPRKDGALAMQLDFSSWTVQRET